MRPSLSTSRTPKSVASAFGTGIAATGRRRVFFDVPAEHLADVHLVDVVAAEDGHELGLLVADDVLRLVHRVGRAAEPRFARPLLSGDGFDELIEDRREPPDAGDVLFE